jgi:hypothetical protein
LDASGQMAIQMAKQRIDLNELFPMMFFATGILELSSLLPVPHISGSK